MIGGTDDMAVTEEDMDLDLVAQPQVEERGGSNRRRERRERRRRLATRQRHAKRIEEQASAEEAETMTSYILWTKPGCTLCEKAISFLRAHEMSYEVRTGGMEGYMRSTEFKQLLANWSGAGNNTPFRAKYPIILSSNLVKMEPGAPFSPRSSCKLVGGFTELTLL